VHRGVGDALPTLPERQVELELSVRLRCAWRTGNLDFEVVCIDLVGGAADPLQEELQVEEQPWVGDEDVHAAIAPGVAAAGSSPHSEGADGGSHHPSR